MINSLLFTREQPIDPTLQKLIVTAGRQWQQIPLISLRLMAKIPELSMPLEDYDWLFFTSSAAVRFFYQCYDQIPVSCSLAVIGTKTFETLRIEDQLRAEYPSFYTSEVFVAEWLTRQQLSQKVLFPQSELSRQLIQQKLRQAGHLVDDFVLYHNDFLRQQQRELKRWLATEPVGTTVVFASPSAWQNFYRYYQLHPFELEFASIGPVTTKAINKDGYLVSHEASECTMTSLVAELLELEVGK